MRKFYLIISFVFLLPAFSMPDNIQSLDSLSALLPKSKGVEKVAILVKLSELNRTISFNDCKNYAEDAIDLAGKLHNDSLAGLASKSLGVSYYLHGDMTNGLKYFQQGYRFYKQLKYKKGISNCLNNMGLVYEGWSQFDSAYKYYELSYEIEIELKNEEGMATSLINIGNINYYRKKYPEALADFFQSLKYSSKLNDLDGMATAYLSMGIIYDQVQDFSKAIEFLAKSRDIYVKLGDRRNLSRSLNNMADIYNEHYKQYKKALLLYEKVLQIKTNFGSKVGVALVKNNLGVLYGHIGNLSRAETYFKESLSLYRSLKDKSGQCLVYFNWALALQKAGKHKSALGNFQRSLSIAKEIGVNEYVTDSYQGLFKSYAALGEYAKFNKYYKLFESSRDSVNQKLQQAQISKLENQYKVKDLIKKGQELQQENLRETVELRKLQLLLAVISFSLIVLALAVFLFWYIKKGRAEINQNKDRET